MNNIFYTRGFFKKKFKIKKAARIEQPFENSKSFIEASLW